MIFYRKFCRKFYRKSYTMSINNEQIPLLSVSYNTSLGTSNDIDNNENNENNENNNENQLLVSSSELNNHITNSENRCFICLENIAEVNHKYYCNCNGYISYVHCECLKDWISESGKTTCDFCKTDYNCNINYSCNEFLKQKKLLYGTIFQFILLILLIICYIPLISTNLVNLIILVILIFITIIGNYKYIKKLYKKSLVLTLKPIHLDS